MAERALADAAPTVVDCPECAGLTFRLVPCRCRYGAPQFLITQPESMFPDRDPYPDCEVCKGGGTVPLPCNMRQGRGRCRAQLVLTVANLDRGSVASLNVVPGTLPDLVQLPNGRYTADLMPLVRSLAAQVGAAAVHDTGPDAHPLDADATLPVFMPKQWRPDLPAEQRRMGEAAGIAQAAAYQGWRLYLAHSKPSAPRPDPDEVLASWCDLADQLYLDLVVEARHAEDDGGGAWLRWDVRFEIPATPLPAGDPLLGYEDLTDALARACAEEALRKLHRRDVTRPAFWLAPPPPRQPPSPPPVDCGTLAADLTARCVGAPGAVATWREGCWHLSPLKMVGDDEVLTEHSTGQVGLRRVPRYMRTYEPARPTYWAGPIPQQPCRSCAGGTAWRRCACTYPSGHLAARPDDCRLCRGAGVYPTRDCDGCGNTRAVRAGAVLTVTDLAGRVEHVNWRPGAHPATQVGTDVNTEVNGGLVYQLDEPCRVAARASRFGVAATNMIDLGDLGGATPCAGYCATVWSPWRTRPPTRPPSTSPRPARAAPAGGSWCTPRPQAHHPIADVVRLILGLGLTFWVGFWAGAVSYRHHAANLELAQGEGWAVEALPPAAGPTRRPTPSRRRFTPPWTGSSSGSACSATPPHPTTPPRRWRCRSSQHPPPLTSTTWRPSSAASPNTTRAPRSLRGSTRTAAAFMSANPPTRTSARQGPRSPRPSPTCSAPPDRPDTKPDQPMSKAMRLKR
jgi:hypothetical protein